MASSSKSSKSNKPRVSETKSGELWSLERQQKTVGKYKQKRNSGSEYDNESSEGGSGGSEAEAKNGMRVRQRSTGGSKGKSKAQGKEKPVWFGT